MGRGEHRGGGLFGGSFFTFGARVRSEAPGAGAFRARGSPRIAAGGGLEPGAELPPGPHLGFGRRWREGRALPCLPAALVNG